MSSYTIAHQPIKIQDLQYTIDKFSAGCNRGRHLFEGGAYLKIGRYKKIVSFNLTVYLPSVRKKLLQLVIEAFFRCHHSPLSALFSGVLTQSDFTLPFYNNLFLHFQCGFRLSLYLFFSYKEFLE